MSITKLYIESGVSVLVYQGSTSRRGIETNIDQDGNVSAISSSSGKPIFANIHYSLIFKKDGVTPIATTLESADSYLSVNTVFKTAAGGSVALVRSFQERVLAQGGILEGVNYLYLNSRIQSKSITQASLFLTANGYKEGKLIALKPIDGSGDLAWSRASTKTRVNPSFLVENIGVNIPSIDYRSGEGAILVEPQATNLFTFSNDFTNVAWSKLGGNVPVLNNAISPDGNLTAVLFSSGGVFRTNTFLANTTYVLRMFVKKNTATDYKINYVDQNTPFRGGTILYNFSTKVITITQSENLSVTAKAIDLINGYVELVMLFKTSSTISYSYQEFSFVAGNGWCYEAGMSADAVQTSIIPTTTTTVTRVADSALLSGLHTKNIVTSNGFTWFIHLVNNIQITRRANSIGIYIDSGLGQNGFAIRNNGANDRLTVSKYLATVREDLFTTATDNVKVAVRSNGVTADIFANGVKVIVSTPFTATVIDNLGLTALDVPKSIKLMTISPFPLTDSELIQLTTL